jgi:hypothetical protein
MAENEEKNSHEKTLLGLQNYDCALQGLKGKPIVGLCTEHQISQTNDSPTIKLNWDFIGCPVHQFWKS